ncbi:MAG: glutamine synthetase [Bacteroidetes bacterium]|nr:glutamine synthetase [Bacteroidota bacterium]
MFQNKIEAYLSKPKSQFTKSDIVRFFIENEFSMLNFRYVAGDGRLKTLSFVINSQEQLDTILSSGERADGSSLFNYVEAGSSDLYVIPQFKTAFVNPFEEAETLDIICRFYTSDGKPLVNSPFNIMKKAHDELLKATGLELEVMGELEFYVIAEKQELYPANDQRAYHESPPFTKFDYIYKEAMQIIAECGGKLKYAHSEVGNFKQGELEFEQYELEFQPTNMEDAANSLILAKYILRMLGSKYGVTISFAPKITVGKAGSGLHIHCRLKKDGESVMVENGILSDHAKKMIAGILTLSSALTAFGNTIPTSYLRLVPHQEAPTNICWGDRNRSVLVRVPLGWLGNASEMISKVNPLEEVVDRDFSSKQTVEFRCPDGSADIYLLMAGLAVATRYGFEMPDALDVAEKLYVGVNIFDEKNKAVCRKLKQLPASCSESADKLMELATAFTAKDVFTQRNIESIAAELKKYNDADLSENLYGKNNEIMDLVYKYLHYA